jgi:Domain of unknown function (DUF4159)
MQYKTHHSTKCWASYRLRNLRFIMMCFVPWLGNVFPSEESFVPWGDVDITCPDISGIGIVRFRAKAESFRVVSVSVEAFGRQYTLSDDQIRQIEDFPLSSLTITCEGGYKELGGPAVHFKFQRMFYDASKGFRDERVVISVHKESEIRISRVPDDIMSSDRAKAILAFTEGWTKTQPGSETDIRSRDFEFTACIGQYNGGNWNSTVWVSRGNEIEAGSLPNLLYLMSAWSKDKIKTNYKNVQAIKLDSAEIFSVKPAFIFLTGTRDFSLSEKEVLTLQMYVRRGGCIWGDSSPPGLRSAFGIAFKREMKRVIPDVDKSFEPLPSNHPIYTEGYFADVKEVPAGLNFYKEPVFAMKIYGEIAILYTANDYGDMWQVGLNQQGQIDEPKSAGAYVAVNPAIYSQRDIYLRNLGPEALSASFKFGTNIVIHLLTRWESKVRTAPRL